MIVPIQQDFANYRNYALKQVQDGKMGFAPGTNKDNFLKSLSVVDGIPGQRTTSFSYPQSYLDYNDNGKHTIINQGYAVAK
jgi:hypothetical protein